MADRKKSTREPVTRAYTINLKKLCHKTAFKKKAPRAIKKIRMFAERAMCTKDVRLDVKLNKAVWSRVDAAPLTLSHSILMRQGIRSIPNRIRVHISRRINDDEDAAVCHTLICARLTERTVFVGEVLCLRDGGGRSDNERQIG